MAIETATANVWRKAIPGPKARRDPRGLSGTVDWTVPRNMLRKLDKVSPNDAGTLRNILAGGTWPQVREKDEIHRWYLCGIHNEHGKDFEYVKTLAQKELNHTVGPDGDPAPLREHLWYSR
eukprot:5017567-Heterocapsa_arctica.AAC.1